MVFAGIQYHDIRIIHKVTLSSPSLSSPIPLFQWYPQRNAFNAQGLRVTTLEAVKIFVAAVEALRK
jgi:hypothetical protein